jgi:hypothetical protein
MDRHMLGMLESPDISAAEADSYFDSYFRWLLLKNCLPLNLSKL